ncbi:MAG: FkbM family methyltransferase [Proteobacteria bacterium]|nr:FkbM family methyltransferase [Pseudomonadota bacterium]MBI3498786.1 FkbM family methyltransferase [Pseudomonadota bacterium]
MTTAAPQSATLAIAGGQDAFNILKNCRHGAMLFNRNDQYVGRSLELYGEYCEARVETLRQLLQQGDVVVDVGAYIGNTTLFYARAVGEKGAVVAFEPQRVIFQTLCANLALNSMTNVYAVHAAVGDERGQAVVPLLKPELENNFAALGLEDSKWDQGDSVPVTTIDNLELRNCRFISVDVEGMELAVLKGAEATIATCAPILFVANHRKDKSAALITHLLDRGYQLYWDVAKVYSPSNFFGKADNVFEDMVNVGMIGLPPGDTLAVDGRQITSATDTWHGTATVRIFAPPGKGG